MHTTDTKDVSEVIGEGSRLVNMNVRISQDAQKMINMMLALKQAEENERKYPKQLLVENMIRSYFPIFLEEFDNRNQSSNVQEVTKNETKKQLTLADQLVQRHRSGQPL